MLFLSAEMSRVLVAQQWGASGQQGPQGPAGRAASSSGARGAQQRAPAWHRLRGTACVPLPCMLVSPWLVLKTGAPIPSNPNFQPPEVKAPNPGMLKFSNTRSRLHGLTARPGKCTVGTSLLRETSRAPEPNASLVTLSPSVARKREPFRRG